MSAADRPTTLAALPRRRLARLAAIQALYQLEMGEGTPESVIREFREHRFAEVVPEELAGAEPPELDEAWFAMLVREVWTRRAELDREIAPILRAGWTPERLGLTLRALLRAGAYELRYRRDVPRRVVVGEYVELAHMLLGGEEPAFANAALDRLARRLRGGEGRG